MNTSDYLSIISLVITIGIVNMGVHLGHAHTHDILSLHM